MNLNRDIDREFDLSGKRSFHSFSNKLFRTVWGIVWLILFRTSPRPFYQWRAILLKLFGAKLGKNVRVCPSCKVWAPWHLVIGSNSTIGDNVDCYNVGNISIGSNSIISQYTYLCSATHDYTQKCFPVKPISIVIGSSVWIAARSYVGPGVTIKDCAIIGANSCVYKDVDESVVVGGNPAKFIKKRT